MIVLTNTEEMITINDQWWLKNKDGEECLGLTTTQLIISGSWRLRWCTTVSSKALKILTSQVTGGKHRPFQFRDPISNSHYWSSHISFVFSSENQALHQDNIRSKEYTTCQLKKAFMFWGKIRCYDFLQLMSSIQSIHFN